MKVLMEMRQQIASKNRHQTPTNWTRSLLQSSKKLYKKVDKRLVGGVESHNYPFRSDGDATSNRTAILKNPSPKIEEIISWWHLTIEVIITFKVDVFEDLNTKEKT